MSESFFPPLLYVLASGLSILIEFLGKCDLCIAAAVVGRFTFVLDILPETMCLSLQCWCSSLATHTKSCSDRRYSALMDVQHLLISPNVVQSRSLNNPRLACAPNEAKAGKPKTVSTRCDLSVLQAPKQMHFCLRRIPHISHFSSTGRKKGGGD